ncbi:D-alanyl-D-alanine carboxypeptidase-like protein [Murinocardiopsis flavida]|uniref:D-alanyl-D-alanine carboxypeptidase-like protein n=1 Tax=Murinocardiopsis flavida TaxID=645275 RepID=A0A2P8D8W3_9ACTN|nr:M15 family metallopeptidase [Murinocardiopsis flavida]PSK93668.1 D-alanyl-D-alanine carboxypeptidase-like protein [Murinocardiopsis flavida]
MTYSGPARTAARLTRSTTLAALVVARATLIGVLVYSPYSTRSLSSAVSGDHRHGALGEADGAVGGGVTVFDDRVPAVANLDPELRGALRRAATDAAADDVEFLVNSGWRSPEYQEQLLREAVSKYGSEQEAARWVATSDTSAHVSGDAVDIGHSDATAWLSEHGAEYGLCQIYRNEPWHYELRPEAIDRGCPRMYADPTHDPRSGGAVRRDTGAGTRRAHPPHRVIQRAGHQPAAADRPRVPRSSANP